MPIGSILTAKELSEGYQPLLLVEITLKNGTVLRYSTHALHTTYGGSPAAGSYEFSGHPWSPRVVNQEVGATQAMSDLGVEIVPQVSVTLADPDQTIYNIENNFGLKGCVMKLYSILWDAGDTTTGSFSSNSPTLVKFIGTCSSPETDEKTITITATSLLNMGQMQMPPIRIQPRCSWTFPGTHTARTAAISDETSIFKECGYSYGEIDGVGNPQAGGTATFTSCSYSLENCIERLGNAGGVVPIEKDEAGNFTGRFGGFRWIPQQSSGLQRSFLTGKWEEIVNASNEARNGDFIPMAYGTTWLEPLVMGAWSDANYSNFEVLLTYGEISKIRKVVVNGTEISRISDDTDTGHRPSENSIPSDAYTDTFKNGFWKTINRGFKNGVPNPNAGWGRKGDPYGSIAAIYISVLSAVAQSGSIPKVQVLLEGGKIRTYTDVDTHTNEFTSNPVWILLDLLTWATWKYEDIDIQSFIDAAAKCDEQIYFDRMDGSHANTYLESSLPEYKRFSVGFSIRQRVAIGELIRGIRNSMKSMMFFDYMTGKLKLIIKETIASQQPAPIPGSNYDDPYPSVTVQGAEEDGYIAYHFNDTNIRKVDGKSTLRMYQKTNQDSPNKVTVSFQNRENSYSQDTATVVDTEDISRLGQEVFGSFPFQGGQTFDHVRRVIQTWLAEGFRGNSRLDYEGSAIGDTGGTWMFDLETSIKGVHLMVGHICSITSAQRALFQQPVRVLKIQPSTNFETVKLTLVWHNDNWYQDSFGQLSQPKYARPRSVVDRAPFAWRADYEQSVAGDVYYGETDKTFGLAHFYEEAADKGTIAKIRITGKIPVNRFPDEPGRPKLELTGMGAGGGGYANNKTYYVALSARQDGTTATLMSAPSKPTIIHLEDPNSALQFIAQNWPDSPSGYFAFVGEDQFAMTYQTDEVVTPTVGSITLTNTYNEASWGAPDEAFSQFRWQIRREIHGGVWGAEVVSVTSNSITVAVFSGYGFTVNQWAGREICVFGIRGTDQYQPTYVPIANFPIASNTANTIVLSFGNPTTCVSGGPLLLGDVVVMRFDPTFGEDALGKYFEDAGLINALGAVFDPVSITSASNTSPVTLTLEDSGKPFPFIDGDTLVVQGCLGNTGANGGFTAAAVDPIARTVELTGSTGNGVYIGEGTARSQIQGLIPSAEKGTIAFIISGTGRGTSVRIKDNTATRYYIDGSWPVTPDSTSKIIILDSALQTDTVSAKIINQSIQQVGSYDIDVTNYSRQSIFVQVASQAHGGKRSPDVLDPFREMFLFGGGGPYTTFVWNLGSGEDIEVEDNPTGKAKVEFPIELVRWSITAIEAPTGDDIIIDLKYNGTSIFLPGDANKIVLPAGSVGPVEGTVFATTHYTMQYQGLITAEILQVGSAVPGFKIIVQLVGRHAS